MQHIYGIEFDGSGGKCNICYPPVYLTSSTNAVTHIRGVKHQFLLEKMSQHFILGQEALQPRLTAPQVIEKQRTEHCFPETVYSKNGHYELGDQYNSSRHMFYVKNKRGERRRFTNPVTDPKLANLPTERRYQLLSRSTKWIYCQLCDNCVNSEGQALVHEMGKKHHQKVKEYLDEEKMNRTAQVLRSSPIMIAPQANTFFSRNSVSPKMQRFSPNAAADQDYGQWGETKNDSKSKWAVPINDVTEPVKSKAGHLKGTFAFAKDTNQNQNNIWHNEEDDGPKTPFNFPDLEPFNDENVVNLLANLSFH